MAEVQLRHVDKIYPGGVHAVRDASLTVADQEFVVLVGPSGCGKSTLLRMIAGLETVTRGEVRIGGRRVNDVPPRDRDIAMVFQSYALYPHMSVFDNMALGLKLRRTPKDEMRTRVQEAARILGIETLLDRRPRQLSGGQRQRVAVGRAIVRKPQVFLFDEPLSNLDAKMRVETRGEIITLHRRLAATIVYVTHDQVEAMTMGDRIVVMRDGVIQQSGTPAEVYHHPANRFVAGFIGSPPMNFVRVQPGGARGVWIDPQSGARVHLGGEGLPALPPAGCELGVRPEALRVSPADGDPPDGPWTEGEVVFVEFLGAECLLHVDLAPGVRWTASVAGEAGHTAGDRVRLTFAPQALYVFPEGAPAGARQGSVSHGT